MDEVDKWEKDKILKKYEIYKQSKLESQESQLKFLFSDKDIREFERKEAQESHQQPQTDFKATFAQSLMSNCRVEINNIYIRVESPREETSFGLEIKQITLDPCDQSWCKIFNETGTRQTEDSTITAAQAKACTIHDIKVSVRTGADYTPVDEEIGISTGQISEVMKQQKIHSFMEKLFGQKERKKNQSYILGGKNEFNLDVRAKFSYDREKTRSEFPDKPDQELQILFGAKFDYSEKPVLQKRSFWPLNRDRPSTPEDKKNWTKEVRQNNNYNIELNLKQVQQFLNLNCLANAYQVYSAAVIDEKYHKSHNALSLSFRSLAQYSDNYHDHVEGLDRKKQLGDFEQKYTVEFLLEVRYEVYKTANDLREVKEKYENNKNENSGYLSTYFAKKPEQQDYKEDEQAIKEERDRNLRILLDEFQQREVMQKDENHKMEEKLSKMTGGNFIRVEGYVPQLSFSLFSEEGQKTAEFSIKGFEMLTSVDEKRIGRAKFLLKLSLNELNIQDPETQSVISEINKANKRRLEQQGRPFPELTQEVITTDCQETDEPLLEFFLIKKYGKFPCLEQQTSGAQVEMKLEVKRKLKVFCNFAFFKKCIDKYEGIYEELNNKRIDLLRKCEGDEHLQSYFIKGYKILRIIQDNNHLKLDAENFKKQTKIEILVQTPQFVIDEYLLAEEVMDPFDPFYVMIDMGAFQFQLSDVKKKSKNSDYGDQRPVYIYSAFDMNFKAMKLVYSDHFDNLISNENVGVEDQYEKSICIIEDMSFYLMMQMLDNKEELNMEGIPLPPTKILNIRFSEFSLKHDRKSFVQIWKLMFLCLKGSFMQKISDLNSFQFKQNEKFQAEIDRYQTTLVQNLRPSNINLELLPKQQSSNYLSPKNYQASSIEDEEISRDIEFESAINIASSNSEQFQINMIFEEVNLHFDDFDINMISSNFGMTMDDTNLDIYLMINHIQIGNEFTKIFEHTEYMKLRRRNVSRKVMQSPIKMGKKCSIGDIQKIPNLITTEKQQMSLSIKQRSSVFQWGGISLLSSSLIKNSEYANAYNFDDFDAKSMFEIEDKNQIRFFMRMSSDGYNQSSEQVIKLNNITLLLHNEKLQQILQTVLNFTDDMKQTQQKTEQHLKVFYDYKNFRPAYIDQKENHTMEVEVANTIVKSIEEESNCYFKVKKVTFYKNDNSVLRTNLLPQDDQKMEVKIEGLQANVIDDQVLKPFNFELKSEAIGIPAQKLDLKELNKTDLHRINEIKLVSYQDQTIKLTPIQFRISLQSSQFFNLIQTCIGTLTIIKDTEAQSWQKPEIEVEKPLAKELDQQDFETLAQVLSNNKRLMNQEEKEEKEKPVNWGKLRLNRTIVYSTKTIYLDLKLEILVDSYRDHALLTVNLSNLEINMNSFQSELLSDPSYGKVKQDDEIEKHLFFEALRRNEDIVVFMEFAKRIKKLNEFQKHQICYDQKSFCFKIEANYFNQHQLGQEPILEPCVFEIKMVQQQPFSEVITAINSKDSLNINLTCGFIYTLMSSIKKAQKKNKLFQTAIRDLFIKSYKDQMINKKKKSRYEIEFTNKTGLYTKFWIDTNLADNEQKLDHNNQIEIDEKGCYNSEKVQQILEDMFDEYDSNERLNSSLFISFDIGKNDYQPQINILLKQSGFSGFRMIPYKMVTKCGANKTPYTYCIMHVHRSQLENLIKFRVTLESTTMVYNNTAIDLKLIALKSNKVISILPLAQRKQHHTINGKSSDLRDKNETNYQHIPLKWFKEGLKIQISSACKQIEEGDVLEVKKHQLLVQNGTLQSILNPEIIEPMYDLSKQMKLNGYWLGVNFQLLKTRTEYGQFLVTLEPKTNLINQTGIPLTLKYKNQSVELPSINGKEWTSVPNLNMDPNYIGDDHPKILTEDQQQIGAVRPNELKIMHTKGINSLGIEKGTLIKLHYNNYMLDCVLQMQKESRTINIEEYSNFDTRIKIYEHDQCSHYVLYLPLKAINETEFTLIISDSTGQTKQILKPDQSIDVNLNMASKTFVKVSLDNNLYQSQNAEFGVLGLPYVLKFRKSNFRQNRDLPKEKQIGTIVTMSKQRNQSKSRILRFVPCIKVFNKLDQPLFICEANNKSEETKLDPSQHIDMNFFDFPGLIKAKLSEEWSFGFKYNENCDFQLEIQYDYLSDGEIPWYKQGEKAFVRVTITEHSEHQGTKFVIFSWPRHPQLILYNFLKQSGIITQQQTKEENILYGEPPQIKFKGNDSTGKVFTLRPNLYKRNIFIKLDDDYDSVYEYDIVEQKCNSEIITIDHRPSGSVSIFELHSKHPQYQSENSEKISKTLEQEIIEKGFENACQSMFQKDHERRNIIGNEKDPSKARFAINKSILKVDMRAFGISLVDFLPQEFCYISIDQLTGHYRYDQFKNRDTDTENIEYSLQIQNIQVDDMSSNSPLQVLFGPRIQFNNIEKDLIRQKKQDIVKTRGCMKNIGHNSYLIRPTNLQKFLEIDYQVTIKSTGQQKSQTINLARFRAVEIEIQFALPFLTKLENYFNLLKIFQKKVKFVNGLPQLPLFTELNSTNKNFKEYMWGNIEQDQAELKEQHMPESSLITSLDSVISERRKNISEQDLAASLGQVDYFHIVEFSISRLKIHLTLKLSGIEKQLQKKGPLGSIFQFMGNVTNLSHAKIRLPYFKGYKNEQKSLQRVIEDLKNHYYDSIFKQLMTLMGSMDMLGNAGALTKNQLADTSYDEVAALSPGQELCHISRKHVEAIAGSFSSISSASYIFLHNLSLDPITYEDLPNPPNVHQGFKQAISSAHFDIMDGVSGIYTKPKRNLETQGNGKMQCFKGVCSGVMGALAYPVNAACSITYNVSKGMKNSTSEHRAQCQRYRYPRYFNEGAIMPCYDVHFAHAQTSLRAVTNGKHMEQTIQFARDVSSIHQNGYIKERVLFATQLYLYYCKSISRIVHQIPLNEIVGIMIYLSKTRNQGNLVVEMQNGTVLKIKTRDPMGNTLFIEQLKTKLALSEKSKEKKVLKRLAVSESEKLH